MPVLDLRVAELTEKGSPSVPDFGFRHEVGMIALSRAMSVKGKKQKGFI